MMTVQVIHCKIRRCGKRKERKLYLVSGETTTRDGVLPRFVRINPPIPYPGTVHRTPIVIDGESLLAGYPYPEYLAGESRRHQENKQGKEWELEIFGMPISQRLGMGCCESCTSAEEALATISGKIQWNPGIIGIIRELSLKQIQKTPCAARDFALLVQAAQEAQQTQGQIRSLITLQAAVWKLINSLPVNRRKNFFRYLALCLSQLNLLEDAQAFRLQQILGIDRVYAQ